MRNIKMWFGLALLLFSINSVVAANPVLSPQATLSVLTCGPGDELYALYGHTALRVSDPINGIDRVYNYGMFDFQTQNFYGKFIKGDLLYFADYSTFERFVTAYVYEDRSVYEQTLNLTALQKKQIWQKLNHSLEPKHREYTYKFIDQNCTTKVADLINEVLAEPVTVQVTGNEGTYRSILNTYQKGTYFANLGINLIFGSKVDATSEKLFLPLHLKNGLDHTKQAGQDLVLQTKTLYEKKGEPVQLWWDTPWVFSIFLLVWVLGMKKKWILNSYFVIMGGLGIFFVAVGFYSFHEEVMNNNSVFLCNPLFMVLPFLGSQKQRQTRRMLVALLLMTLLLFVGLNLQSEKLILALPLVFANLIGLWSVRKHNN